MLPTMVFGGCHEKRLVVTINRISRRRLDVSDLEVATYIRIYRRTLSPTDENMQILAPVKVCRAKHIYT